MIIPSETHHELLYWVDEQDRVLGSVSRKRVHDERLLHREVALLVFDEKKGVLFQKRSMKKRSNPGLWSTSVAGHIEFGTEPLETALREAKEEVGLEGIKVRYLGKELLKDDAEQYFKYWFSAQVSTEYPFILNREEVDEVRFFSAEELTRALDEGEQFNRVFVERVRLFWTNELEKTLLKEEV
jgi:isopentenyldiphosphate isomerase